MREAVVALDTIALPFCDTDRRWSDIYDDGYLSPSRLATEAQKVTDRKRSAFLGRYQMPLSEFETEYVHPQDNGFRTDVRWLNISNGKRALRVEGYQPLCIRAWDYGEEDLETAKHPYEIQRGRFVNLNIDLNVHGVGGIDTWGQRTLPQYTIDGNKPYHYAFILTWK